jgi:hypothetical protein
MSDYLGNFWQNGIFWICINNYRKVLHAKYFSINIIYYYYVYNIWYFIGNDNFIY